MPGMLDSLKNAVLSVSQLLESTDPESCTPAEALAIVEALEEIRRQAAAMRMLCARSLSDPDFRVTSQMAAEAKANLDRAVAHIRTLGPGETLLDMDLVRG